MQHKASSVQKQWESSKEEEKTQTPRVPRNLPPQQSPRTHVHYPSPLPQHFLLIQGGFTLVHSRRNRPTDAQGFILSERLTEVLQHGHAQALATVHPPDKHGVEDRQQVARTCAITTQAACRERK